MESTSASILASAMRTLAREPMASMAIIAKEAKVGRATLHRHVASRKELIVVLALEAIAQTDRACASIDYMRLPPMDALRQTLLALAPLGHQFAFLTTQPEAYAVPEVERELERQRASMLQLIEACQHAGGLRQDLDATWINAMLDALIYAAWAELSAGRLASEDAGERMYDAITRGCGA